MTFLRSLLKTQRRPPGVLLALGGGGARGLAHLGVLSVLEEAKVPVVGIAGTSAGAVAGALWLVHGSAAAARTCWAEFLASGLLPPLPDVRLTAEVSSRDNLLLQFARSLKRGAVLALALERRSLVSQEGFDRAMAFLLGEVAIETLRLPLAVVAADFATGRPVVLREGSLRLAVAASSAIPGVVPPYRVGELTLVDGGVVADVPVEQARELGSGPIVAVEAAEAAAADDPETINVPRALLRAGLLTQMALRERLVAEADLLLRPCLGGIHWSDFTRADEAYEAGRVEAATLVEEILRLSSGGSPNRRRAAR